MRTKVIAMLTNHDKTVPDALDVFEANKRAKTQCWGFKDIGISDKEALRLVEAMKAAGKTTFLEPLLEDEESCMKAAQFAVRCRFDCVINMVYNQAVADILQEGGIKYMPTCGRREGLPRMLYGTAEEIISHAEGLVSREGVAGICLSSYRYVDGEPEAMSLEFRRRISADLIVAGGIGDYKRLDFIKKLRPWGFTIGSALFARKFGEGGIAAQLDRIQAYIDEDGDA